MHHQACLAYIAKRGSKYGFIISFGFHFHRSFGYTERVSGCIHNGGGYIPWSMWADRKAWLFHFLLQDFISYHGLNVDELYYGDLSLMGPQGTALVSDEKIIGFLFC